MAEFVDNPAEVRTGQVVTALLLEGPVNDPGYPAEPRLLVFHSPPQAIDAGVSHVCRSRSARAAVVTLVVGTDYRELLEQKARRVIQIVGIGSIGMCLATAELARGLMPSEYSFLTVGNVAGTGGAPVERVVLVQHPELPVTPQTAHLGPMGAPIVGRSSETEAVRHSISSSRLVTVVASCGAGKTSLLRKVVAETAEEVVWICLQDIEESRMIPVEACRLLEISVAPYERPEDALLSRFREGAGFLVLDGCERHLDFVAHWILRIHQEAPGVQILCSSLSPLGVPGETVFYLGSMTVPSTGLTWAVSAQEDAVRLVLTRINTLDSRCRLSEQDCQDVIAICQQCEGHPLSLELAAECIAAYGAHHVRSRMNQSLTLLSSNQRIRADRHRSLKAALDYQASHLRPEARTLIARLAVPESSFDYEDVEAMWGQGNVTDAFRELITNGILIPVVADTTRRAFHLQSAWRTWGQARSISKDARREAVLRLQSRLLDRFGGNDPEAYRHPNAIADIEVRYGDIHSAIQALLAMDASEEAARLAINSFHYLHSVGRLEEAHRLYVELDQYGSVRSSQRGSVLCVVLAIVCLGLDRPEEALTWAMKGVRRAIKTGDLAVQGTASSVFGQIRASQGRNRTAFRWYARASSCFEKSSNNGRLLAALSNQLGTACHLSVNDYHLLANRALRLAESEDSPTLKVVVLNNLADRLLQAGELHQAFALGLSATSSVLCMAEDVVHAPVLRTFSHILWALGHREEACLFWGYVYRHAKPSASPSILAEVADEIDEAERERLMSILLQGSLMHSTQLANIAQSIANY